MAIKILGFEVIIHCDNYVPSQSSVWDKYLQVKKGLWSKGEYIAPKVEFGASPIRDRKALDRYCELLESNGLAYTVHPILRGLD